MIFEAQHSLNENQFRILYGKHLDFPLHIHRSFEYFQQSNGSTEVTVGSQKYVLTEGDAVLIFPLQPHSYTSLQEGSHRVCIFSPDIVAEFYKKNHGKIPLNNKFRCSLPENPIAENTFHKKSIAYFICGEFENSAEYVEKSAKQDDRILIQLLLFADKNLHNKCLLRDAAIEMGYDYAYVSKHFKRKVGVSFKQYVNNLRITESKQLLLSTEKSIEEIGADCGFTSLRTYDREFRNQTGMSPSEYRKKPR